MRIAILLLFICFSSIAQERKYTVVFDENTLSGLMDWLRNTSKIADNNTIYIGLNDTKSITNGTKELMNIISIQIKPQLDSLNKLDSIKHIKHK